jgi:superfamily I DNA/RNA helicase
MFRLPTYQELSKEQDKAYNLPIEGHHMVIGPPGTGKTVIAVYRAEMLKIVEQKCDFVVFNNTLNQYLGEAIQEKQLNGNTRTFYSWFGKWYYSQFKAYVPEIKKYKYDWKQIISNIGTRRSIIKCPNLILDEGQDFPPDMYIILRMMVEQSTIFADENQRIRENNSTVQQIQMAMGVKTIHSLHKNYRNTRPIAELASWFYTGLPSGIPDLPDRAGSRPRLIQASRYGQVQLVSMYAKTFPTKTIGVFLPSTELLLTLYNELIKQEIPVPIQVYSSEGNDHTTLDFKKNGIFLMCYPSAKGLEFDTVILPWLEEIRTDCDLDEMKMKFYVLTSRAREELILLSDVKQIPRILEEVPAELYKKEKLKEK